MTSPDPAFALLQRPQGESLFHCDKKKMCNLQFSSIAEFAEHMRETGHCLVSCGEGPQSESATLYAPDFAVRHLGERCCRLSQLPAKSRGGQSPFVYPYLVRHNRWRCAACRHVFFTWVALKEHMMRQNHCIMRCEDCNEILSWEEEDENSPERHCEAHVHEINVDDVGSPLHAGVIGYIRRKNDFVVTKNDHKTLSLEVEQYVIQTTLPDRRMIAYRHKLLHAYAMLRTGSKTVSLHATCMQCRDCAKAPLWHVVVHLLKQKHTKIMIQHYPELATVTKDSIEYSAPIFMYQCSECFALRRTWAELATHMSNMNHCKVFCFGCTQYIDAAKALAHFDPRSEEKCKERNAFSVGFQPQVPRHSFVAIDRTDVNVLELIDQPDEAIDVVHGEDSAVRLVYQCPLETCLRCFGDHENFQSHLTTSKHGIYTCPDCGEQYRIWTKEYIEHDSVHKINLPEKSHLAGKRKLEDFLVIACDTDLLQLFPNYFMLCPECNLIVHPAVGAQHAKRECPIRRELKQRNVSPLPRETLLRPSNQPALDPVTSTTLGERCSLILLNRKLRETQEVPRNSE